MDGRHDVRPARQHRASDPSLEDMLRRARDARLGDDQTTPPYTNPFGVLASGPIPLPETSPQARSVALFLVGVMVGILLCYGLIQANASPTTDTTSPQAPIPTQSAATALPTSMPTATPPPTDTPTPFPTTITATELAALAQRFYDTLGPDAGTYVLMDTPTLLTISADSTNMTLCVAYQYATVADPNTAVGSDARWFRYTFTTTEGWSVQAMGPAASCSLS